MSLDDSPSCLFTHDQMQFSAPNGDNIFDEVFDQRLYDVENDNAPHELANEVIELYANDDLQEDYPRLPSLSGSTSQETSNGQSPPQPWRKGLWCLNHDGLQVNKTRKPILDTVSASQLISNPAFLIRSPPTPSPCSTMNLTKRFVTSPNAAKHRYKGLMNLPLSRENTLSPTPLYSQLPLHAKMEQVETWQQDFKNFNLQSSQRRGLVGLADLYQDSALTSAGINALMGRHGASQLSQYSDASFAHNQRDQLTESLNQKAIDESGNGLASQTQIGRPNDIAIPAPTQRTHPTLHPLWTTESLHSSNTSHHSSHDAMPSSLSSGLSNSGLQNALNQGWWSPEMAPPTPGWATTPRDPYPAIAAPTPKRAITQSFADNIDRQTNGLGIRYGDANLASDFAEANMVYSSVETSPSRQYSPRRHEFATEIPPVPPLPFPLPAQHFPSSSPFASPDTVRRSPTRAPSPSVSPLSMTPHSRRGNRSPSRLDQPSHSHHRRKSIHKPGPIKSIANATNDEPLPSANSTRARSRSHSKAPRTPKTPKTPTGGFCVDFVNFTARDASKLLSDVAPSGSSKTRARREAEAKEKRKKLSEAALKAVSSAGGDTASIEALKRAILA